MNNFIWAKSASTSRLIVSVVVGAPHSNAFSRRAAIPGATRLFVRNNADDDDEEFSAVDVVGEDVVVDDAAGVDDLVDVAGDEDEDIKADGSSS